MFRTQCHVSTRVGHAWKFLIDINSISTTMKYDSMKWSSQLESACTILSAHREVDGDQILVALARLSKVALEAGEIYRQVSDDPDATIHPAFSIAPLKCSLRQTKDMLTPEQLQHSKLDNP